MINQFLTDEYVSTIQKVVREVVNDPTTYRGASILPAVSLPVRRIRTEVIEASGGLTQEHGVGTDVKYIQSFGTRVQEFEPPAWKEAIHYDEAKLLYLRELGNNNTNVRGVQQYIDLDIDRLNRRLEARIEKLRWDAIFTGGFSYMSKTFSYGIPSQNEAVPVGAVWSTDGINANSSADPLVDIRYWCLGGYAPFRKYKIGKMIMNPNTARWILDNPNVQSLVRQYFASDVFGAFELNKSIQMLIPGAPTIEVYDGWYQEETISAAGKITVGNATFFIPDGSIFFEVSSLPGGDKIGEFVMGMHLADGSIQSPGFGKFLVIDDNTAKGTRGGPGNPFVDIVAGCYGGVKMDRPFDTLTASVVS